MAEDINIAGRFHSTATGNVVAGANEIYDDIKGKKQNVVNQETDEELALHTNRLNALTSQNYVTVEADSQTTDVAILIATDAPDDKEKVDTVYRVGQWDGTQYDTTVYSEYAWNGIAYILLNTKEYGVDNVPTAGSRKVVESGGVAANQGVVGSIVALEFEDNKRYNTGGTSINPETDVTSNNNWRCAIVDCAAGDTFSLSGQGGGDSAALCTFIASDGTVLKKDVVAGLTKNFLTVAPTNAAKCLINDFKTGLPCYKGSTIMALVAYLQSTIPSKANDNEVVKIIQQSLTAEQKAQAINNLGIDVFMAATNAMFSALKERVTFFSYENDNTSGSEEKIVGPIIQEVSLSAGTTLGYTLSDVSISENGNGYIQVIAKNGETVISTASFLISDGSLNKTSDYITLEESCTSIEVKGLSDPGTSVNVIVLVDDGYLIGMQKETSSKADVEKAILNTPQTLTQEEKTQALTNLGINDFITDTANKLAGLESIVATRQYVNDNTSGSSSKTIGPLETAVNIPAGTNVEIKLANVVLSENANGYIQVQLYNGETRTYNKNFMTSDGTLVNGSVYTATEQQTTKVVVKGVSEAGTSISAYVYVSDGELIDDRTDVDALRNSINTLGQKGLKIYPDLVTGTNISSVLPDANNALDNTIYFILSRTAPSHFPDYYPANNAPSIILETKTSGTVKIQSIRDLYTNDCLWQRQSTGTWGDWVSVGHKIVVNKASTTNKWVYSSLYEAIRFAKYHKNTEITVESGTYDLIQEMGAAITGSNLGILLGSNMKIYCQPNVYVTCNYTGDDDDIMENFSAFMTGEGDWEIDGMNLACSKVRYCIHDDMGQSPYQYKHILKNCKLYLDNTESTWRARQCIGGGLGKNGKVIIENCTFESIGVDTSTHDDANSEVSYHNSSVADAQSTVRLSECYFVNSSVSFGYYGASTKITEAIVNGCSCKWVPLVRQQSAGFDVENIELKQWNNEIRQ